MHTITLQEKVAIYLAKLRHTLVTLETEDPFSTSAIATRAELVGARTVWDAINGNALYLDKIIGH